MQINSEFAKINASNEAAQADTEAAPAEEVKEEQSDDLASLVDNLGSDSVAQAEADQEAASEQYKKQNPLFAVLNPSVNQSGQAYRGPVVGTVHYTDTAKVMSILNSSIAKSILTRELRLRWTVKAIDDAET